MWCSIIYIFVILLVLIVGADTKDIDTLNQFITPISMFAFLMACGICGICNRLDKIIKILKDKGDL